MSRLKHPVGTRFSNSETYDQATDEVIHGWQVFEQCRPDGTFTGRKSFIDNHGCLCGIDIAEAKRRMATESTAPELLEALQKLLARADALSLGAGSGYWMEQHAARVVIAKAAGITEQ